MKRLFSILSLVFVLFSCKPAVNTNGVWLWSKFMNDIDLDEYASKDIKNIILHELSFERHGVDSTLAFIKSAHDKGMKVHIWFQAFYTGGKWINPVDDSLNRYKQEYFDEVIERAVKYVNYGVDGIHLDYIRFGGTAHKHNPSAEITATGCVTEFCKQISEAVKAVNPKVILSAALMPEPDSEYYYGQDPAQMGKYIDILMPMIYFHCDSYRKGGAPWAVMVANHFATKGAPAKVWAGLTTYVDTDTAKVVPMNAEQIYEDCKMMIEKSKAEGVVLFRYGLGEVPDLHPLAGLAKSVEE